MVGQRLRDVLALTRRRQGSLRRRILVGNLVIAFFLVVASSIVVWQVRQLVTAVHTLEQARVHVDAAVAVRQQTTDLLENAARLVPGEDAVQFSTEIAGRLETLRASQLALQAIAGDVAGEPTAQALAAVNAEVANVINIAGTMVRQARAEQWHSVAVRVALLNRDQEQVIGAVDALLARVQLLEAQAGDQVNRAERSVVIYPSLVLFFTLILGAGLVAGVTDSITRPVEQLTAAVAQLAAGAFELRVPVERDDEIGQLGEAFNRMAAQLQGQYEQLEARVAERTRALETGLQVARRLSTILEQETLSQEVVDQIQQAFNYYHVHIYLFDVDQQNLTMVGGTGEAGRTMLRRGHRLKAGQGLVGRAAAQNEVILAPDVREWEAWLPNPLLPETRSELAVPITFGNQVRGVLDVQHHIAGSLGKDDAELMQTIAAQVAVALQNAQLMAQVQTRADRAARVNAASKRIQAATSIEEVLQAALQELGQTLPVDQAAIELHHPHFETESRDEPWAKADIRV